MDGGGSICRLSNLSEIDLWQSDKQVRQIMERTDRRCFYYFIAGDIPRLLEYFICHVLWCRTTIGNIIFDAKIMIRAPWVVAGGQQDATSSFVFANYVGGSRSGQNAVLANDKLGHAISSANLENDLNCVWRKVSTISTKDDSGALGVNRIEDGLHKVFCIVLRELLENSIQRYIFRWYYLLLKDLDPAPTISTFL